MKCQVIRPPSKDACGKSTKQIVEWSDGSTSPACRDCALYLGQIAQSHGTILHVVTLKESP